MDRTAKFTIVTVLLGVFMGALDSGIVSPALSVLNRDLSIDFQSVVWVVTLYTLVYAVSMPLIGKLADRYGRRMIFIIGILIFGVGSLICGLSHQFWLLLVGRAVQAVGGGGIMPIANAMIAQTVPKEKRGMALGLVGSMFGIATIIGPTVGSFLIDQISWRSIFFVNIPISIIIWFLALRLPKQKTDQHKAPLDIAGGLFLGAAITFLLLGITNIDQKSALTSLRHINVWGLILLAIIATLPFIFIEKKAKDPIVRLPYFKDKNILMTFLISTITGIGMISTVFLPSFSEVLLKLHTGVGGYVMTVLAAASGFAAPIGGMFLDRWGAKRVVVTGFLLGLLGSACLSFATNGWTMLMIGMILSGVGIGFTVGTPLNYIILELVSERDSGVALSLVSLFRSVGTTTGPIILASFLTSRGANGGMGGAHSHRDISTMPEFVRTMLVNGYHHLYLAAATIFFIGVVFSIFLRIRNTRTDEKQVQQKLPIEK
ncbi:MFS transporter [Camelliibacillus cellulosilyticus]|uniref:MFS transporter n=1 Tax=Camelliibacillus cellulosilyticus TaxID=2174486 RepID=A0ABV9GIF3_9BACL